MGRAFDPVIARSFGENLARIRKEAALSQDALSTLAGLHRTGIAILERGNRLPRLDTVIKLAGAMGVDPGELLDGIERSEGDGA
jgi:transcriptional regulator with XRE-family HTH domain